MRLPWKARCYAPLALAFCASVAGAQAASPPATPAVCPWLTQGTAARVLGGEVSLEVHVSEAGEGSCRFALSGDAQASLKIEVSKSPLDSCSAESTALKGIGNEARRCKIANSDTIAGRVRDTYFTIAQSAPGIAASANASVAQDDALEQAAEAVAGNLF